jgi:hypothetical protein
MGKHTTTTTNTAHGHEISSAVIDVPAPVVVDTAPIVETAPVIETVPAVVDTAPAVVETVPVVVDNYEQIKSALSEANAAVTAAVTARRESARTRLETQQKIRQLEASIANIRLAAPDSPVIAALEETISGLRTKMEGADYQGQIDAAVDNLWGVVRAVCDYICESRNVAALHNLHLVVSAAMQSSRPEPVVNGTGKFQSAHPVKMSGGAENETGGKNERLAVRCNGTVYKSVAAAFDANGLPGSKAQPFRLVLREHGERDYEYQGAVYHFEIVRD